MKNKFTVALFLLVCIIFAGPKEKLSDEYICCMASNKINQVYKIKFSKTMQHSKILNAYIPQKNNDNIIIGLKNLLSCDHATFCRNDFASAIKINSSGQKFFLSENPHSQEDAIQKAKGIMKKFFMLETENILVKKNSSGTQIKFIENLDGIKNYSFCSFISFDENLKLRQIIYCAPTYKKIGSYKIKSLSEAINNLPVNFAHDTYIELTKCELCYVYLESVVQGAYFFSGLSNKNESVNFVVKALKFN